MIETKQLDGRTRRPLVLLGAIGIFLLAYLSPLAMTDSDPAMALVAAQTLLHHGTLALDVYRGDPAFAYELEVSDHRIHKRGDSLYYYSLGLPIFSLPMVGLANLLGFDMLDQRQEFALQELISAAVTATVFVLLYMVARFHAAPPASFTIALVSSLGSALVSTLAGGLWNTGYQVLFLGLFLIVLHRGPLTAGRVVLLLGILGAAFLARPTTAFLGVAFLVHLLGADDRRIRFAARCLLAAAAAVVVLAAFDLASWIPRYYSPRKIFAATEPWTSLYANLLSPSRGLFVWSPFLIVVTAAAASRWRALVHSRLPRLMVLWITLHFCGVMMKAVWWAGHAYGPRFTAELLPAFVVLTAWTWPRLERRTVPAVLYVAAAGFALFIHSYQGLFEPATQRWNRYPDVDDHPENVLDWRYPQFLATDTALEERFVEIQRRGFGTVRWGEEIGFASPNLLFQGWHEPEDGWRWSRGRSSELIFDLGADTVPSLLELHASILEHQDVGLELNGTDLGWLAFGPAPVHRLVMARGLVTGENRLRLVVPGAQRPLGGNEGDQRVLGLALRSLRLVPFDNGFTVTHADDAFFVAGFSSAEAGWRWSDGRGARLVYPLAETGITPSSVLEIEAGAMGTQRFDVAWNGVAVGAFELAGPEIRTVLVEVPAERLRAGELNEITFTIPGARRVGADARLLGLRLRALRLRPPGHGTQDRMIDVQ